MPFQHTAARRRLPTLNGLPRIYLRFQHTAARRRLLSIIQHLRKSKKFQHTAARRRLLYAKFLSFFDQMVSTHSRTEAAAPHSFKSETADGSFNTQPHGGGCQVTFDYLYRHSRFNTQPHGGGCSVSMYKITFSNVSTHSRTEAAAWRFLFPKCSLFCFNTQPHGGGCKL